MAEESGTQGQGQGAGQQEQQGAATGEQNQGNSDQQAVIASDHEEIESRLAALGGALSEQDREEIRASMAGKKTDNPASGQPGAQQKPAAAAAGEGKKDEKPAAAKKDEKPEGGEGKKDSIFGFGKKKADEKGTPLVIESYEQILPVIQKEFGMEIKDVKEVPKFFEASKNWRKQAQQFEDVNKKHTQLLQEVENLPVEFHEAFRAFAKGEDWKAPFNASTPKFDYKLPVEKQDVRALVEQYFPNKFTDDDFKAEEKSPQLELTISLSKEKYSLERSKIENGRATQAAAATKQQEAYNASVAGSAQDLTKAFPEMDSDAIQQVQSVFEGGPGKLLSHFFNENGTVKPDAMRRLAMALHGESEIQRMMEYASHVGETKANEEILSRGADGPDPRRSSGQQDQVPEEVARKIAEFDRLGKQTSQRTY